MKELLASAKDNLTFLLICLGIIAGLFLLAWGLEKWTKFRRPGKGARYLVPVSLFSAVSAVLMVLEFPVFFAPGFYKMDFSELPALIAGFWLGPVAAVTVEFVKSFLNLLLNGTTTAFVGEFASFATGCALVLPASVIYQQLKNRKGALIAMVSGTAFLAVFASFFNAFYLLPKFSLLYGMPLEAIIGMGTAIFPAVNGLTTFALLIVAPFNLFKGAVLTLVMLLIYKRLFAALQKK